MPKLIHASDINEELYDESKNRRMSKTNKRLRRLPGFETINYKKTCEVKKTGHSLQEEHQLNDGNLRYTSSTLAYSLNKKKRWLLPDIIEQRICEYEPVSESPKTKKGDQVSSINERLKIIMYENENTRHTSNCLRYANSQTIPQILHQNGRRFNSTTLTKWINFDTRQRWNSHNRTGQVDRVNQPNFGIQQRPGFFPSEVTYEFLFPKRCSSLEDHKHGKTSLTYANNPFPDDSNGRHSKDTNKKRRTMRRGDCSRFDMYEQDYDFEQSIADDDEPLETHWDIQNTDGTWSAVFAESYEPSSSSTGYPIDYFIPSTPSSSISNNIPSNVIIDYKANKYFEPPSPIPDEILEKPAVINEKLLCSIPCINESDFLFSMQQSTMKISQANLSPPIFIQTTSLSSFSVVYTYCRTSSIINATLKFTDPPPHIVFRQNEITLEQLIELVSNKLDEYQMKPMNNPVMTKSNYVDALRGSLPLSTEISQYMLLVRPNSTDKKTALQTENINDHNEKQQCEQWFDTTHDEYDMLECSVCCETLITNDAYQLLPCRHTLCHSCLTSYIRTSISSATYSSSSTSPIVCFQPNCSTELNSTLLQAFISYEIFHSYHQSILDRHLFSSGHYRKCPSSVCSNLLIIDDKNEPSLMCSCGQRVCSKCLEEYHFPATCAQYKSYVARLRESGDDLLSVSKVGDNTNCYIAEGKNCPNCGEFVEKNGGCPHMTCKCGNEYCWTCLQRWAAHNYSTCFNIPESTHELRSSTRNRLHNKAIHHRRQRNQYKFDLLSSNVRQSDKCSQYYGMLLSTYIDLNTLAEFVYVLLQRRRTDVDIRAVLGRTASRLESDAFQIQLQIECEQIKIEYVKQIRLRLERTMRNLIHMKRNKVLV